MDVAVACWVLNVSRSGYYDWACRPASPRQQDSELLVKHIRQIHADSRQADGLPWVHAELPLGLGLVVNLKCVARLIRDAGIQGLYRRRHGAPPVGQRMGVELSCGESDLGQFGLRVGTDAVVSIKRLVRLPSSQLRDPWRNKFTITD